MITSRNAGFEDAGVSARSKLVSDEALKRNWMKTKQQILNASDDFFRMIS